MKIPNAQHAIVDIRKVQDYCLNPQHNSEKHKARMFASALGMGPDDAEALRKVLLQAVKTCHAWLGERMSMANATLLISCVSGKVDWRQFGAAGLLTEVQKFRGC